MSGERFVPVLFQAHIELLQRFMARRAGIVEQIQGLLSAQDRPGQVLHERPALSRLVEDRFFATTVVSRDQLPLRGQLQQAHWASGFRPRDMPEVFNDLIDPGEMMGRGFQLWRQTRWPGRNGRLHWAQTLFNLYMLRCLELLVMRVWDEGHAAAAGRLALVQRMLDELWKTSPADQPVLVRDARWLVPVAQSPTTDELWPYFTVAAHVAASLSPADRLEIQRASVLMAGGHLRSQLRHFTMQGRSLEDAELTRNSRRSNALDFAATIQGLVPLLQAYEQARQGANREGSLVWAEAICQGVSADPELFVNRLDLLGAYSMIEPLFISVQAGTAVLTPMGQRHVALLQQYRQLMPRLSPLLHEDCARFRPVAGSYSPYGVMYGFSTNIIEHMAMKALQPEPATRFSLEDVFTDGDAARLDWVSGWRRLPHVSPEVQRLYAYPQQFAEQMFARVESAFGAPPTPYRTGLLRTADTATAAPLPVRYVLASDSQLVAEGRATACSEASLLHDRREGEWLVSYPTAGGWVAITKDVLTEVLAAGQDAGIGALPPVAASMLRLICPDLIR